MDAQALGRYLRETREAKELTLDEVERALRIRRRILESFESGEFNIPEFAAIQIRGFMRNYARHLGLEEDRIVAYYEAALVESANPKGLSGRKKGNKRDKRESNPALPIAPRSVTDTPPSLPAVVVPPPAETHRQGTSVITIFLRLLVAAAALAVIAYVVIQLMQPEAGLAPPAPDGNILGDLPPTPTDTPPLPTADALILLPTTPPDLQPGFTGQGVLVTINTAQRTWLKITADGADQYEGIARPGTRLEYPAGSNVTVVASNAAALGVVFNGQQQQSFGGRGQLVTVVFSASGVQISSGPGYEPTPEQSPTPLPTPTDAAGALVAQLTPTEAPFGEVTPTAAPDTQITPTETLVAQLATSDTLIPVDIPVVTAVPSATLVPPSSTPALTETLVPSATPEPTDAPTLTPVPSATPVPTDTPTPTNTITPSPTFTWTPSPTFTVTPSNTPVPTNTPIPSNTPIPTATSILPPRGIPPDATPTKVGK